MPATAVVPAPETTSDEAAAGLLIQGLTAGHLISETCAIRPGDVALVQTASAGWGLLLTQLIKACGGKVLGTVSPSEKVEVA